MAYESFEIYLKLKMRRLLLKPYVYWPAYRYGIIDEKGYKLREPKPEEKPFYTIFDELLRRIRVMFDKYVPGAGTKRYKVFKEFMADGFLEVIDEEYYYLMQHNTVCESSELDFIDSMLINWLNERKFYA